MVVQERRHPLGARFRQHAAGVVVEEAVDHHPVEAGQAAELVCGALAQGRRTGRALKRRTGRVQTRQQFHAQEGRLGALLDLDQSQIARALNDDVVVQVLA